jgi:lysozyme family protein
LDLATMTDQQLLDAIIRREGETYTNDPSDLGGPTKFGITWKTLQGYRGRPCDASDVQALTRAEAEAIYREKYLKPFALVPHEGLRAALADFAVTSGPSVAVQTLQRVLGVPTDGVLGHRTLAALLAAAPALVLGSFVARRVQFYCDLVDHQPSQLKWFHGWTKRAMETL